MSIMYGLIIFEDRIIDMCRSVTGLFLILLFIPSCNDNCEEEALNLCLESFLTGSGINVTNVEFYDNYSLWRCSHNDDYRFTYLDLSTPACTGINADITVSNNIIIDSLTSNLEEFQEPFCNTNSYSLYRTIDELFAIIQAAIDERIVLEPFNRNSPDQTTADVVSIEYDETYGYPVRCNIDYVRGIADDEFVFEIIEFRLLQ